ncbi:hypothetical protein Tco_1149744 [Tanacetum coccineum]
MHRACSSPHLATKEPSQLGATRSLGTKQASTLSKVLTLFGFAEARRRKFLELFPEGATNEEPVLFRTSIIPWWAWITHSHLPEAELLNGRAAMIGFFMGYLVDVLTGLDVVGQSGNFICKIGLFATVLGVILFRQTKSLKELKNLADEATSYDK